MWPLTPDASRASVDPSDRDTHSQRDSDSECRRSITTQVYADMWSASKAFEKALSLESETEEEEDDKSLYKELASKTGVLAFMRMKAFEAVSSSKFDLFMGIIILLNAAALGVEQTFLVEGRDLKVVQLFEVAFTVIYVLELCLRLFARGCRAWRDFWTRFDALLIVLDVSINYFLSPILGDGEGLKFLNMVRLLKLLRLARAVRMIVRFRDLWVMVRGLSGSGGMMLYTFALLSLILYVFSVVSMVLITQHSRVTDPDEFDPDFKEHVDMYFSSIPATMLTLMQFVYFDSIAAVYRPLTRKDWTLSWFFIAINLVVGIVLMNLVTAVIVNRALEEASSDKDRRKLDDDSKKKKMITDLAGVFRRLDTDKSGQITLEEFLSMAQEDQDVVHDLMPGMEPATLFQALDVEGDGGLDIDQFCDGIWQVVISKTPLEMKRIETMMESVRRKIDDISEQQLQMWQAFQQDRDKVSTLLAQERHAPPTDTKPFANMNGDHGVNGSVVVRVPTVTSELAEGSIFVIGAHEQSPKLPKSKQHDLKSHEVKMEACERPTVDGHCGGTTSTEASASSPEAAHKKLPPSSDDSPESGGALSARKPAPATDQAEVDSVPSRREEAQRSSLQEARATSRRRDRRHSRGSSGRASSTSSGRSERRKLGPPLAEVPSSRKLPMLLRDPPSPRVLLALVEEAFGDATSSTSNAGGSHSGAAAKLAEASADSGLATRSPSAAASPGGGRTGGGHRESGSTSFGLPSEWGAAAKDSRCAEGRGTRPASASSVLAEKLRGADRLVV